MEKICQLVFKMKIINHVNHLKAISSISELNSESLEGVYKQYELVTCFPT